MYNEVYFPHHEVTQRWETFSQTLERPLRILDGGCRTMPTDRLQWRDDEAVACGRSVQECQETGLTIVSWGTLHDRRINHDSITVPNEFWNPVTERYAGRVHMHDTLMPPERYFIARPLNIDTFTFGEVAERTVCIYMPLPNLMHIAYGDIDWGEDGWLRHAIDMSIDEDLIAELNEARENYNRERYFEYVRILSDDGVNGLRDEVGVLSQQAEGHRRNLVVTSEKLKLKSKHLKVLLDELDQERGFSLDEEWDRLESDERIESIDFHDGETIVLETKPVMLKHPHEDREAELGPFRWRLTLGTAEVHVENIGNPRGGYDHPHIRNHYPCFGEMGDTIYTMVRSGQLAAAVEMVFLFLKTIQLRDDWSRRAAFWFDDDAAETRRPQANMTDDAEDADGGPNITTFDEIVEDVVTA